MTFKSNNPSELGKAGFFVTGTDTEVGKTLISGALITHLKKQHAVVAAFKLNPSSPSFSCKSIWHASGLFSDAQCLQRFTRAIRCNRS